MKRTFQALAAAAVLSVLIPVQAATIDTVSLLTSGPQSFSANSTNTVFSLTALQPAGSGVFHPFVRIQGPNGSNATGDEQGYNSIQDNNYTLDDTSLPGNTTPIIPMSTVLDSNGQLFLTLDYNEPGNTNPHPNDSNLVLKDLQLVVSSRSDIKGDANTGISNQALGTPAPFVPGGSNDFVQLYRMSETTKNDTGNQFYILMNANNNNATGNGGSGQADLNVQIDLSSLSSSLINNKYLYVYSRFGDAGGGYEEWRIAQFETPYGGSVPPVPLPAAAWAGISMLAGLGLLRKLRQRNNT